MANSFGVPGISVQEFAEKMKNDQALILLDIREDQERLYANLDHVPLPVHHLPLSRFDPTAVPSFLRQALNSEDKKLVIMCHHGIRSAQLTYWLQAQGHENILNLDGGIDAWAVEVDPQTGRY